MSYIAHISEGKEQTCYDHCRNTAVYAADDLCSVGLEKSAYLAGLLHDCAKCMSHPSQAITYAALCSIFHCV